MDVYSVIALQTLVLLYVIAAAAQLISEPTQAFDQQRRMGSPRRMKIRINAQMDFELFALKPAAAAVRQIRWFGNLRNSKCALIECPCTLLTAHRHRQLHVFQALDQRCAHHLLQIAIKPV
jgi:hypothetical protein